MTKFSLGILTVSDTCSNGLAIDTSGPYLETAFQTIFNPTRIKYEIVPDDMNKIEGALIYFVDVLNLDIIITTGGTGFGLRDVTPEATRNIIHRETQQLTLMMSLYSLEKTKFAALSRSISGIRNKSLIINFPGSKKAVVECFDSISAILPHAVQHLKNNLDDIKIIHKCVQGEQARPEPAKNHIRHVCPHKTGTGSGDDRNSPYPMFGVTEALEIILKSIKTLSCPIVSTSDMDLPPFRASIKDGYALKSSSGKGEKRVLEYVAAGDGISIRELADDECFKINTGAAVPNSIDCIIQVEDTKLKSLKKDGTENIVEILVEPTSDLDIRPIGNDLKIGELLFAQPTSYPGHVVYSSMLASIGKISEFVDPVIGIISTGDELLEPGTPIVPGKIYDSNMTMLKGLLQQFGFTKIQYAIAKDEHESLKTTMESMIKICPITICTGGVSMGDKDFVKTVMKDLGFSIHFGRVNMKPGKPMTFASNSMGQAIFGLPGNPVSAFVTFHLFVLPALRFITHYDLAKLELPIIMVELLNEQLELDPRPEYARASVISRKGKLYAEITGNQISSRLKSIDGADVILHLPAAATIPSNCLAKGTVLKASVLKHDFISKYEW